MGVLAPGSAHAKPSAQPHINLAENFWRSCLQSKLQNVEKKNFKNHRGPGEGQIFLTRTFVFIS